MEHMEKKKVLKDIEFDTSIFITSFDKAVVLLNEAKAKLEKEGWSDVRLYLDTWYDRSDLIVQGMRLETDSEFNQRVKKAQARVKKKEAKEKKERDNYERLKSKFEEQ